MRQLGFEGSEEALGGGVLADAGGTLERVIPSRLQSWANSPEVSWGGASIGVEHDVFDQPTPGSNGHLHDIGEEAGARVLRITRGQI